MMKIKHTVGQLSQLYKTRQLNTNGEISQIQANIKQVGLEIEQGKNKLAQLEQQEQQIKQQGLVGSSKRISIGEIHANERKYKQAKQEIQQQIKQVKVDIDTLNTNLGELHAKIEDKKQELKTFFIKEEKYSWFAASHLTT